MVICMRQIGMKKMTANRIISDERQYKVGTKFSVKNPFIETTDNYEVTNVGKDYVGIVGPGGVFQRILKEDFEGQFFNKRLKKEEK